MSIILLDGGVGQETIKRSHREATPLWSAEIMLHDPQIVQDIHVDFIKSGAQIITLNTYTATPQRLLRHNAIEQLEPLHHLAMHAAQNAIQTTNVKNVKIAGCLPPLIASYHPETSLSFDKSLETYRHLVSLQSPASDLFICETMASINDARAACIAAKESKKPVWVAFTVKEKTPDQLRSGESLKEAAHLIEALGADAVLVNCNSPETILQALPHLKSLSKKIGAYANGFVSVSPLTPGGTVKNLQSRKDLTPEEYALHALEWIKSGVDIIGGCCEVSPQHMKTTTQKISDYILTEK